MNIKTLAAPAMLGILAFPALAADKLEEVVVTAELRGTSLMDSSHSASVLEQAAVRRRAAQHLEEVLNAVPNVNFAAGTSRARYLQVRGVGERSQFQEPLNPSVGLLIDGVDFSGIGSVGTLFDIEQVEILRGPQGTLHGANALAGLVNIRSNAPSEEFHNRVEAGLGDYATRHLGLVSSGPLSDALLYRVAVQRAVGDGYQKNAFIGRDDTNDRDELTLRLRLRVLASERHSVNLGITRIDIDNGYDAFSLDNTRTTLSDQPGEDTQESLAVSLRSHSQHDGFDMQISLSTADSDIDYAYDEDWTYEGFHDDGYSSRDHYGRERRSVSAELRLLSNERSRLLGGRADWVAGIYHLANQEDLSRTYTSAPFFESEHDTDTAAVYAQLDTALSSRLTLVTGLRWESRKTDYSDNNAARFNPDASLWGGRLTLEYRWGDSGLLYGGVSRGYRAGGVNASILASIGSEDDPAVAARLRRADGFDEETLLNVEAGLKSSLMNDRLRIRMAAFYMDRQDQQVKGSFLVAQASGATTFIDYTSNAAEGKNYGIEAELDWLVGGSLQLQAALGLLKTEFNDYVNADGVNLSGRDQAHAPDYQYALSGRYDLPADVFLSVGLEGKGGFFFSDSHDTRSDSVHLLNASLGMEREGWRLALWGRNLTDESYQVRGFRFGNDPRNGYATQPYYQFGEPRMWGATAAYTF